MADVSRTYEEKIAAIIENLYGDKEVVGETANFDNDKEPGIIDRLGGVAKPTDENYTKNYGKWGGNEWVVNGALNISEGAVPAANIAANATVAELIVALKDAGLITPDSWTVSALACPSTSAMPTSETAANSAHISSIEIVDGCLAIDLDCTVEELEDADHGATWGTHKWIGFGIRTGLDSIVGVTFTDDTGASAVLSSADADEASTLSLSEGDFVLYIKAEDAKYLKGEKFFTLKTSGYATVKIPMFIREGADG